MAREPGAGRAGRVRARRVLVGTTAAACILLGALARQRPPGPAAESVPAASPPSFFPSPGPGPAEVQRLDRLLRAQVGAAPARSAAVWVQLTGSGAAAGVDPDRPFLAASLIKLPVMAAVFARWQEQPGLRTAAARRWMRGMIRVSDNPSTDRLLTVAGGPAAVTGFLEERGWRSFRVSHGIYRHRASRAPNTCTAREVTEFLAALDRRELVHPEADEAMWRLLCTGRKRRRIPAGLPPAPLVWVGNKTGTLSRVIHDAAIVRTPRARYALCILMEGHRSEAAAERFCRQLSRLIFETLHRTEEPEEGPGLSSPRAEG